MILVTRSSSLITISYLLFRSILLHNKVVDDKVLSLHSVLAHVESKEFLYKVVLAERYLFESDFGTDKVLEFIG